MQRCRPGPPSRYAKEPSFWATRHTHHSAKQALYPAPLTSRASRLLPLPSSAWAPRFHRSTSVSPASAVQTSHPITSTSTTTAASSPQPCPPPNTTPASASFLQHFTQGLVQTTLHASLPHLHALPAHMVLNLLEACKITGCQPPQAWVDKLFAVWPVQDLTSTHVWNNTVRLLTLSGAIGILPPKQFLDTVYCEVADNACSSLQLPDISAFLSATSRFRHHPIDRDLTLSLTSHLLAHDSRLLRSATAQQVAQLLPLVVANGHAAGTALTTAVLSRLQPHLEATAGTAASQQALPPLVLLELLEAAVGPSATSQLPAPLQPSAAAAALACRLHSALPSLPTSLVIRCLAALAACRLPLDTQLLSSTVLPSLQLSLQDLQPRQLATLAVSLQRFSLTPHPHWAQDFHTALFSQLGRFDNTDELVEVLQALTALDRQIGFKLLNQLSARAAARIRKGVTAAGTEGLSGEGAVECISVNEVVNTLFLLSYLNHNPGYEPMQLMTAALQPHLQSLSGTQLTNVLWALARLGRPPSQAGWMQAATSAASCHLLQPQVSLRPHQLAFMFGSLQSLGAVLQPEWVDQVLEVIRTQLPAMSSHDVALVLNTISRLQHVTTYAWMSEAEAHISLRLEVYQPKELTTVMYAMAKLHHRPPSDWLLTIEDHCLYQLDLFSPDNAVTLLWSLIQLGHPPGTVFLDALCARADTALMALNSQDLVSLLACLAKIKYQPDTDWLFKYLSVLHFHLPLLDAPGFSSVVQSFAHIEAELSSEEWWNFFCTAMRPRLPTMTKEDLIAMTSALPKCGLRQPPKLWVQTLCARVLALVNSASLSPEEAERTVVALGALGIAPPAQLLNDFLGASLPRLASLSPNRITRLVSSFTRSGIHPSRSYLEGLVAASRASVYSFTMIELKELLTGLTQLNSRMDQPVPAVSDFLAYLHEWMLF